MLYGLMSEPSSRRAVDGALHKSALGHVAGQSGPMVKGAKPAAVAAGADGRGTDGRGTDGASSTGGESQPLRWFGNWLLSLAGLGGSDNGLRESLEELIEEEDPGAEPLSEDERTMLRNLLEFGGLEVEDVMVPRADIVAVAHETPLDEVVGLMSRQGHSRLPVYRGTLDDVLGMVHVRDLLRYWGADRPIEIGGLARRLLFVPPSMPVRDLLVQMRATKVHMALVVDEHGGTDGLVTIEDLVEEIVGEIEDEHDRAARPLLIERDRRRIEADARVPVPELEAMVGLALLPPERQDDIDTLGGLVFELAGRVPEPGERIVHPAGLSFEILEGDPRRIRRLCVHRPAPSDTDATSAADH